MTPADSRWHALTGLYELAIISAAASASPVSSASVFDLMGCSSDVIGRHRGRRRHWPTVISRLQQWPLTDRRCATVV